MKKYTLRKVQMIRRPREEVFSFFSKPENLKLITPPGLDFIILTPLPINMKSGTLIDYSVRILGVRRHWTTLIIDYNPPEKFVDVQLKGPYTFWHHTHTFKETEEGTLLEDNVQYIVPFGILGRLAHALLIRRQLNHIFEYRAKVIRKHLAET